MNEIPKPLKPAAPSQKIPPRLLGFMILALDAILVYVCIVLPFQQASDHADSVTTAFKGVLLVPALLVIGVMYSVAPAWTARMSADIEHKKWIVWTAAIIGAAAGGILYWAVKSHIEAYGYKFD
ncbi:MAG TPA: hypothetical protein VNW23_05975 [Opitutaceae bacterium]|jgi:hypothetical protein|nr:hypothetical protein [Opitutaceae bacterium]